MPNEEELSAHEYTAQHETRDENGQFIHVDKSVTPLSPEHHSSAPTLTEMKSNPLTDFVRKNTHVSKSKDDDELLDIHIGNPLRKITELLEEIKKQKAFSFSIKGSLGVAGIVLVLGTFGIFGGTKALCSKGVQTKIGHAKVLAYLQQPDETILDKIPYLTLLMGKTPQPRTILIDDTGNAVRLKGIPTSVSVDPQVSYVATGEFDSCSQTLTVDDPGDVELR